MRADLRVECGGKGGGERGNLREGKWGEGEGERGNLRGRERRGGGKR